MSARLTELEFAELQARRGMRTKPRHSTVRESAAKAPTQKAESRVDYKAELLQQFALVGIKVEPEFKFCKGRKWSADWRVIGTNILVEFEGGLFQKSKGGHSSVSGILRDIEKYNAAALEGYTVIRVAPNHVRSGEAVKWVDAAIKLMLSRLTDFIMGEIR